jgi:hypothetical protein
MPREPLNAAPPRTKTPQWRDGILPPWNRAATLYEIGSLALSLS